MDFHRFNQRVFQQNRPEAVFKQFLHYVRYHPNSGAKADIPALRIWATKSSAGETRWRQRKNPGRVVRPGVPALSLC